MKWYVDFNGYCEIEADTSEKASEKFWNTIQEHRTSCGSFVYADIEIEPAEEGD